MKSTCTAALTGLATLVCTHTGLLALRVSVLGLMTHTRRLRHRFPELLQPLVKRMCADPRGSGHLPNRIPPHRDLIHSIPLELVAEVACPHGRFLGSKEGGKGSTDLGAPQSMRIVEQIFGFATFPVDDVVVCKGHVV